MFVLQIYLVGEALPYQAISLAQSDGNDKIEEEDKAEYAYPDLNNCFYQRFCLMETLYSVLEKKQEDPEEKMKKMNIKMKFKHKMIL